MVCEVRPERQRRELLKGKKEEEKVAAAAPDSRFGIGESFSEDEEDDDDGDIFAQFTGGPSKKKE
jgi:hypothetical protein